MWRAVSRRVLVLLVDRAALPVEDEGVASDRDDGPTVHGQASTGPLSRSSASAASPCSEAGERRPGDAGTDLADARLAVGDPGVDDRRDARVDDAPRVDARSGVPTNPSGGQLVGRVARERDPAHQAGVLERVGRAAADEPDDRRRRRHREAADAERLGDRAVAEVRVGVLRAVAREEQAVRDADRRREPGVAGARQPDPEVDAVAAHRGDDRRALDAVGRIERGLAGRHRQVEEEVVVAAQEVEDGDRRFRVGGANQRRARSIRVNSEVAAMLRLCPSSPIWSACPVRLRRSIGPPAAGCAPLSAGPEDVRHPAQPRR